MWLLVLILALIFVGWSVVTQYKNTPIDKPVWSRIWSAVVAGGLVIVGIVGHWLSAHGTPPG
jgi:hypothetical protein